jgi:large conductance mechanosensitive channel
MHSFIQEFKAFAMRGNVVDLAVAVVIGGAFGKIVTSLVDNIITPVIGSLLGGIDLTSFALHAGAATLAYGKFFQAVIDFVIIAFVIFVTIKTMNRLKTKEEAVPQPPQEPAEEVRLLREIRDLLRK